MSVAPDSGPESVAIDAHERPCTGVKESLTLRFMPTDDPLTIFARLPPGCPLGLAFDQRQNLFVAYSPAGLLRISTEGHLETMLTMADGVPLRYADDLDIATDATTYITDATSTFDPFQHGGTHQNSRLNLLEHGGHGRLIESNSKTR